MVIAWHGCGMASVNQTRPHCVNQMGKTHYQTLSGMAWQGNGGGAAWGRPAMSESAFGLSHRFNSSGTADPEHEGTTSLRNVGDNVPVHTA